MTFEDTLNQAVAMLQRQVRLTYQTLQLQFHLDDAYLEVWYTIEHRALPDGLAHPHVQYQGLRATLVIVMLLNETSVKLWHRPTGRRRRGRHS